MGQWISSGGFIGVRGVVEKGKEWSGVGAWSHWIRSG